MRCITCGANAIHGTTTDVTELSDCLVIVRNVPCHKCSECNEIIYTGDVVKCLEKITESAKQVMSGIAIVEYSDRAA